jgi:hypothetical protein
MPVRLFFHDQSFDPEAVEILHAAYTAVCADLRLGDHVDGATEIVAMKVIELGNDARDPQLLRAAVLAALRDVTPATRVSAPSMADPAYARAELGEENWDVRLKRVSDDTRDLIAATRRVIDQSREYLAVADASLRTRFV